MTVWIVKRYNKNGYDIDKVFDNEAAARTYRKTLTKRFILTGLIRKDVESL